MPETQPTPPAHPATPAPPTDPEVVALKAELERLKARTDVMTSLQSALATLTPTTTDAPKGEVTLGDKSGSLAPWVAQALLSEAARGIADRAGGVLGAAAPPGTGGSGPTPYRVLVTEDRSLLQTDVVTRSIQWTLTSRAADLEAELELVTAAADALQEATAPKGDDLLAKLGLDHVHLLENLTGSGETATETTTGGSAGGGDTAATTGAGTAGAATTGGGAAAAPIDAAIGLLKLTATDYKLTAADVSAPDSLLAMLTAGMLSRPGLGVPQGGGAGALEVLLDGVGVMRDDSVTWGQVKDLAAAVDSLTRATRELRTAISPLSAQLAILQAEVDQLDTSWQAALADKDAPAGGADKLKDELDVRRADLLTGSGVAAPAVGAAEHAEALLTAVAADLQALLTADAGGVTPLQRACSREGLHDADRPVTHVLHVSVGHAGADVVTRTSVLGSSGRVGYLSGVAVGWALLETATGRVVAGGPELCAGELVHDLTTGKTVSGRLVAPFSTPVDLASALGADPAMKQENTLRWAVLILAGAIALLAVLSVIKIFLT